ncbi:MAG: polysaccharide pyruvyl transferase family protein [Oscillospiraceae bacterium]|nr:polysaccharide pyruvyl transferase family protein [Oscillospiraceae bacterium]
MKLGILTFHRSINYGAFMQCYSLSHRLQKDFPELQVEVIDYSSLRATCAMKQGIDRIADPAQRDAYSKRIHLFDHCCERLPLSDRRLESDDLDALYSWLNETYDIIVVGSDAVWNWNVRGFPNAYFLKGYHGTKLSYAASAHGLSFRGMTPEQKAFLSDALSEFSYLGVRDVSTEQMLHLVDPGLNPRHNCDPTMLLDISSLPCDLETVWEKLKEKGIDPDRPIFAVMASPGFVGRELRSYLGKDSQLIALYEPNEYAGAYMDTLDPFEWAKVFSLCSGTVTHFFHGTLLSLVNGIPPMATEPAQGFAVNYVSKIRDVLTRLEMLECYHPIPMDRISKAKRKLGLKTDRKQWQKIAGDLLYADAHKKSAFDWIRQKVEKEAESYQDFKIALERCIEELVAKERKNG